MHLTRTHLRTGNVQNTPLSSRSSILPSGPIHPLTQRCLIRQFHQHIPPSAGNFSHSAHAEYEDVITYHDYSAIEDQAGLLNDPRLLPQKVTCFERHANNVVLPVPDNGACQSLASGRSELGASRYHMPHSVSMDILCPTGVETPMYSTPARESVQHQLWALSHSVKTSILRKEREGVSWKGEGSDYEKQITPSPTVYPSYLQLATSEYGCASESSLHDSRLRLSQQPVDPAPVTDTVEAGREHSQSSIAALSKSEIGKFTVCSFISGGIKHYRCECGFESASKGRMDRHRDSLQHSKRKHGCSCGRSFTRVDSLNRHKKKCSIQRH